MLHVLGELIAMRHVLAARGAEHEKWVELDADQLQSVFLSGRQSIFAEFSLTFESSVCSKSRRAHPILRSGSR